MKKLLVSLMAMSVLSVGAAAYAGSLSDALQNAADRVGKKEQAIDNAQKEAAKRQEARQKAYEKQNIYTRLSRIERKLFKKAFNNLPLATRMENITNNMDAGIMYNISNNDLSKLERKVLGRTFEYDDTESRITRMEKEMLGAMQSGNLKERFDTIKTASKHYNSYPEVLQSQTITPQTIYPQYYGTSAPMAYYPPSYGSWNTTQSRGFGGFLKNMLGSMFSGGYGTMTGYTPPIYDPYSQFDPGIGIRNEYHSNTRSYLRNRNYGTGSGVRILD